MKSLKARRWATDDRSGVVSWRALMAGRSPELIEFYAHMVRRRLCLSTIDKRMSILARCEHALGHPLVKATTEELCDWLDGHKLQARTRCSYISHLSSFWKWATREEVALSNPTERLDRPILRHGLPRPVSPKDLAFLIEYAPDARVRAMITLAAYAGFRCMEIAGLDAGDVMEHLEPPVIVVSHGKGDKPRVVPVPPLVIVALHAHGIPAYGPVFRDEEGVALKPWKISQLLRAHMYGCDVKASAHQLRHSYGTELYKRSGDLRMVQDLMGHSSPVTTAGYAAWDQNKASAIVATLFT